MSRHLNVFIGFVIFSLLFLSAKILSAQQTARFAEVDRLAQNVPDSQATDIQLLVSYLTQHCKTETEKARAFYAWITYHIDYDWETFQQKAINDQSAEKILRARKAVCEGYANLFRALCIAAKIPCEVVNGYAKSADYQIGMPIDEPNHSWNVLNLGGVWHLTDLTWGDSDDSNTYNYYFLTAPEKLIFTHLPERPTWQLLSRRVSMYEFERKQIVYPAFFELKLQNFNHVESLVETNLAPIYFTFSVATAQSQLAATLKTDNEIIDLQDFISRKYNWVNIKMDSLKANQLYEFSIYGAPTDSTQNLDLLITYYISTGKSQARYLCTPKSDFKRDSITGMPYWFMIKYIENAQKGRYVTLEKLLHEGLTLSPNNSWLYFRLGDVYERLSIIDKAITAYQKAIDLSPDYYEPHYNLGVLYYNRAIDVYDSWRKINPEENRSKEMKKELVILLAKAKPHVIKALELHPDTIHLEKALKNINHFVN
jgi:tetratricopeptide (TPR) repeat protein